MSIHQYGERHDDPLKDARAPIVMSIIVASCKRSQALLPRPTGQALAHRLYGLPVSNCLNRGFQSWGVLSEIGVLYLCCRVENLEFKWFVISSNMSKETSYWLKPRMNR